MAAQPRRRPRPVQDLLDLRFHRCRQYRSGHGCAARRLRRDDRAGDAGLSGDRAHGLPGQSVRRSRAAQRKPAEGSPAQPDARFQPGAGAGAAEQDQGRPGQSRDARRGAPTRFARGLRNWPGRASARPSSTPCSTPTSRPSARSPPITGCRSAPPASGSDWRGRWSSPARSRRRLERGVRHSGRRTGGVSRRQLLAGDAGTDCQCRKSHAGAASRSRPRRRRHGGSAARGGVGDRANQLRAGADREQRAAGASRSPAIASWPQSRRTCHRAGDGRHRRRAGAIQACAVSSLPVAKRQAPWSTACAFPDSSSARKSLQACRFCAPSAPKAATCCLP